MTDTLIDDASSRPVKYWHKLDDERIQCDLCPRFCKLREGQRGLCFVRGRLHNSMVLTSYGRSSGFCIDPIEKKPLNHFYPGSSVLSFGTAGCNLACKFCQNWDMSKSRELDRLLDLASPEKIARIAHDEGCRSVAFTYNDPVIFHEYAIDVAIACHELDIKTVAVSAGYVCDEPRAEFYNHIDAANIDLKAFTNSFYKKIAGGELQPVLDTLMYIHNETDTWLEITTLLIPGENDSESEITALCEWVVNNLGDSVPIHFTAFHPDWKMMSVPSTPKATLDRAYSIGKQTGLRYVYVGNVSDIERSSTYCHACGERLIGRNGYTLTDWQIQVETGSHGTCKKCGAACAGHFSAKAGDWGSKRQPINMSAYK